MSKEKRAVDEKSILEISTITLEADTYRVSKRIAVVSTAAFIDLCFRSPDELNSITHH